MNNKEKRFIALNVLNASYSKSCDAYFFENLILNDEELFFIKKNLTDYVESVFENAENLTDFYRSMVKLKRLNEVIEFKKGLMREEKEDSEEYKLLQSKVKKSEKVIEQIENHVSELQNKIDFWGC